MKIGYRDIGVGYPPAIISEISANHCGNIDNARALIKAAKMAGADFVKTQCYEPQTITLDVKKLDFISQSGLWKGRSLYELYEKACTPFSWHKELYDVARSEGITIFSSVFDYSSVDLLESLGCPAYKIASYEIVDTPLIEYAAKTNKPLIISTGLARDREILEAKDAAGDNAIFLHCTSEYPGTIEASDLGRIGHLKTLLHTQEVGISDHSTANVVPIAATALGVCMIEKHLKLYKPEKGETSEDDAFSLFPMEFGDMVLAVRQTYEAMKEQPAQSGGGKQFRRSLYAVEDIRKGDIFTKDNIRSIRPGYGLPPKMLPQLLGRKAKKDFRRGDPLS
jgi:N-acetylneuraminate synthase